jgi:hypothetical protein
MIFKVSDPTFLYHRFEQEQGSWQKTTFLSPEQAKYATMREWQKECFELRDIPHFILKAPSGSGKSKMAIWFAIYDRLAQRKQLITVPQKGIGDGFSNKNGVSIKYNGKDMVFLPNNLCHLTDESRINLLIEFLFDQKLSPINDEIVHDGCLVTTHQAWVLALKKIEAEYGETGIRKAFQNISIYVDECHHCESKGDTGMGKYIAMLLRLNIPTLQIRLITATFFRGDGKSILPPEYGKSFGLYSLPWDEFIKSTGIEEYHFKFVYYDKSPLEDVVHRIAEEPNEYHLIIIPRRGFGYRTNKTLQELITMLQERKIPLEAISDMVTPQNQAKAWKDLCEDGFKYHVVISCQMFNEGKDWPQCNRIYDTAFGSSIVLNYQKPGRGCRSSKGKKDLKVTCYVKRCPEKITEEHLLDYFNDRFNILLTTLTKEELSNPIKIPTLPTGKTGTKRNSIGLCELFYGEPLFLEKLISAYESCNENSKKKDAVAVEAAIRTVCKKYYKMVNGIVTLEDLVAQAMVFILRADRMVKDKDNHQAKKIDMAYLRENGFKNIVKKEPLLGSLVYGTTENVINMIPRYRKALKSKGVNLEHLEKTAIEEFDIAQKNINTQPQKHYIPTNNIPLQSWVSFSGTPTDEKNNPVSLISNIGFILDKTEGAFLVKVYPKNEVSFKKGKIYLDKKLIKDEDKNVWRPWYWRGGSGTMKKFRNPFIPDASISKTVRVNKNQITFLTF